MLTIIYKIYSKATNATDLHTEDHAVNIECTENKFKAGHFDNY